jgi:hypothetical protein
VRVRADRRGSRLSSATVARDAEDAGADESEIGEPQVEASWTVAFVVLWGVGDGCSNWIPKLAGITESKRRTYVLGPQMVLQRWPVDVAPASPFPAVVLF